MRREKILLQELKTAAKISSQNFQESLNVFVGMNMHRVQRQHSLHLNILFKRKRLKCVYCVQVLKVLVAKISRITPDEGYAGTLKVDNSEQKFSYGHLWASYVHLDECNFL